MKCVSLGFKGVQLKYGIWPVYFAIAFYDSSDDPNTMKLFWVITRPPQSITLKELEAFEAARNEVTITEPFALIDDRFVGQRRLSNWFILNLNYAEVIIDEKGEAWELLIDYLKHFNEIVHVVKEARPKTLTKLEREFYRIIKSPFPNVSVTTRLTGNFAVDTVCRLNCWVKAKIELDTLEIQSIRR